MLFFIVFYSFVEALRLGFSALEEVRLKLIELFLLVVWCNDIENEADLLLDCFLNFNPALNISSLLLELQLVLVVFGDPRGGLLPLWTMLLLPLLSASVSIDVLAVLPLISESTSLLALKELDGLSVDHDGVAAVFVFLWRPILGAELDISDHHENIQI